MPPSPAKCKHYRTRLLFLYLLKFLSYFLLTVSRNSCIFVFLLPSGLHRHLSRLSGSIFLTNAPHDLRHTPTLLSGGGETASWSSERQPQPAAGRLGSDVTTRPRHHAPQQRKFLLNWTFLLKVCLLLTFKYVSKHNKFTNLYAIDYTRCKEIRKYRALGGYPNEHTYMKWIGYSACTKW